MKITNLEKAGALINELIVRRAQLKALDEISEATPLIVKIGGMYAGYPLDHNALFVEIVGDQLKTDITELLGDLKELGVEE